MILRPYREIKLYRQLVTLLQNQIAQHRELEGKLQEIIWAKARTIESLEQHVAILQKPGPHVDMPFPDLNAVAALCDAYFQNAPEGIVQQAVEGSRNFEELKPQEFDGARKLLVRFWRASALKRLQGTGPSVEV